ncbi:MipA/OmpV family protein [Aureivirga sp. CE67]|uniref:MipA/OmpV family protein n=1 Tax=Aureivirga sp. CE67 TaxID=1788983 RepID=UPI0018C9A3DC|nr:MipA/OmpV family protein [Aureivirga sp. CE67]
MKKYVLVLFLIGSIFYTEKSTAQTQQNSKKQDPKQQQQAKMMKKVFYSVGAGAAVIPEFEGSNDYRLLPLVNFSANWMNGRYIRVNGLNTEANILKNRKWNFGPMITAKIDRDNSLSNSVISRLPEIDFAFGAGLFGKFNYKRFHFKASYTYDITDVSNGGLANLELGYNYRKGKIISRSTIQSSYATSNYLNTYFGVTQTGSLLSDLPVYNLEAGFKNVGLSSSFIYALNQKWMLGTAVRYNLLIGDVADSPIVSQGSEHQFVTALFALYRF